VRLIEDKLQSDAQQLLFIPCAPNAQAHSFSILHRNNLQNPTTGRFQNCTIIISRQLHRFAMKRTSAPLCAMENGSPRFSRKGFVGDDEWRYQSGHLT